MDYNEIFGFQRLTIVLVLLVISLGITILKSKLHIIVYCHINNKDISIRLNIKYLFSLININKQVYPPKNKINKVKQNKKKGHSKKSIRPYRKFLKLYKIIRKIEIYELYSKIEFGTENIEVTSFLYVLINSIYGFLASYLSPKKIYLGVNPNFTESYIVSNIKLHIQPTIKELMYIGIEILKIIIINKHHFKGGNKDEGDRVNTESNGNNA